MSQRDLVAELRAARVVAPSHVRDQRAPDRRSRDARRARRFTWRRALVIALPVAAAVAAAVVVTRPSPQQPGVTGRAGARPSSRTPATTVAQGAGCTKSAAGTRGSPAPPTRAPALRRVPVAARRDAEGRLGRRQARAARSPRHSAATPSRCTRRPRRTPATADLTLKVPRSHVGQAIARLSALGTIIGEQVDVQDAQAGLNATDRTIARLQRQLGALRAQEQTDAVSADRRAHVAHRAAAAAAGRDARARTSYATVRLHLATSRPPRRRITATARCTASASPSAGSGSARSTRSRSAARSCCSSGSAGSSSRTIRRRREDALLSRP